MQCVQSGDGSDSCQLGPNMWPMHVKEDERVGRSIALVLAVVALKPARLGRNREADLADELRRAFVEAGRFGSGASA
jgi:hypothetical protein